MEDEARRARHAQLLLKYRVVCICNTIFYPRVKAAIDGGACDVAEVAKATGCTTGDCQGERCIPVIEDMLRAARQPR